MFSSAMQAACWWPGGSGSLIRAALLRWMGSGCGERVDVQMGTLFSEARIEIGNNVYFGSFCNIGWAKIGDWVMFGSNVHVISGGRAHSFSRTDIPIPLQQGGKSQVSIGRGAWIGSNATILADIGEECVVGAGSVVVNPLPAWSIAVGSPARVIRSRKATPSEVTSA